LVGSGAARGGLIEVLYAKRDQITMHRIGGREEERARLPESNTSSMLEPFHDITVANQDLHWSKLPIRSLRNLGKDAAYSS